jgi:hypothetical protein
MADPRTSFSVLEDSSSQAGLPLHKVLEGDAYAAKNALAGLVAKSGSNLSYLKVDPSTGALLTTAEGAKECEHARGEDAAGSASFVDIATITLTNGSYYEDLTWVCSCFRDAHFQIVRVDDVGGVDTETIIADVIVGSGDYTDSGELKCFKFQAPASDVNVLKVKAKNMNALSALRSSISISRIL